MRMSCNGCRVLRKGCSENCSIRPCLQWIKSPESQANATVFLAKFYGRAGLLNLINTGPQHLRPAIFRSLLYEACGRIVNPIYGSVGLLWSGNWSLCQNAVEAVLKGAPIVPIGSEVAEQHNGPPFKAYDIRHVSKDEHHSAGSNELHRVRTRPRFKKSVSKASKSARDSVPVDDESGHDEANWSPSHDSSLSHLSEAAVAVEDESVAKVSPLVVRTKPNLADKLLHAAEDGEIELELTLGFEPVHKKSGAGRFCGPAVVDGVNKMDLGLDCPARAG